MIWAEFSLCAILMITAAYALCREGMILAAATHLDEGVIGIFFLAVATSFPEIVVGVSSVSYIGNLALGYGDLVGSVMINTLLLVVIDFSAGRKGLFSSVTAINLSTLTFWAAVAAVITVASILRRYFSVLSFGPLGFESLIIIALYFVYIRRLKKESSIASGIKKERSGDIFEKFSGKTVWGMWLRFIVLLAAVMGLGVWMASVGEKVAVSTGLSHSFIGGTLLALVTSFPEIAVTFAALKAGSVEMAMGNVFGSNLFDLSVVSFLDIFTETPITGYLTNGQIAVTAVALLIPLILLIDMKINPGHRKKVGFGTLLASAAGLGGIALLYYVN